MPICIHCSQPLSSLYMRYGKEHIVLSPCPSCSSSSSLPSSASSKVDGTPNTVGGGGGVVWADEYLEHDLTIVIIDLILAKPKAYRHLLLNRASILSSHPPTHRSKLNDAEGKRVEWGVVGRRFLALSLVDAYVRWFYLCVQPPTVSTLSNLGPGLNIGGEGGGKVTRRIAKWLGENLPMQAGIFFPSLFTPQASNTGARWTNQGAISAVCSAIPVISRLVGTAGLGKGEMGEGEIGSTLVSYLNVLIITLVEGLAMHLCVGLLSFFAVRTLLRQHQFQPPSSTTAEVKKDEKLEQTEFTDPLLPSKAILLSQLSPLILLTFVLLWSTKFPHHPSCPDSLSNTDRGQAGLEKGWIVWIIRTFLSSLNARVALGTILPSPSSHHSTIQKKEERGRRRKGWYYPPLILGAGWTIQSFTSWCLFTLLS